MRRSVRAARWSDVPWVLTPDGCRRSPRCDGFNTEPGVIYHAHDLPPCLDDGSAWLRDLDGYRGLDYWLCERHLQEATEDDAQVTP